MSSPRLLSLLSAAALTAHLLQVPAIAAPKAGRPATHFRVATAKVKQDLEITPQGKKAVAFKLTIDGSCQRTVNGVARLKGGDLEMDEDEKGAAYPALEYLHRGKDGCELFLRIKYKVANRAIVQQAEDCKTTCPPVENLMFRTEP